MSRDARYAILFAGPPLLWFASQQGISFFLHAWCRAGTYWPGAGIALFLLIAGAASWGLVRLAPGKWGALLWVGIFFLALMFQALALLILEGCLA
ncbi:hypothetical protein FIM10_15910 [Sphingomonadales bacterium 56]|uniref:hypothetical protein n=1 Tax=unclassified Sphingobium TaxID=2611147 RepID=UPI001917AA88|nr:MULTISPECIES: hypothetical protein [unclassified Sphingobium]MBY2930162.1 hypothetical protein [Sphingomonadales bacterium 56]MBY2959953.1 hypothetical protein [Sphingomonadales bacterium 58]CAD7340016.1 hypothetical protein SPHS8_02923 [Sphingobium sp. S8]CAD7340839.1 hypothetical protein SPHS6_03206 [Sphingobium sp. S6]